MKTKTICKSLLVAAGLLVGSSAWADGNKRVLESENYENAAASDWTCPNGSAVIKTGDATYGKYAQCYPSGSGNRSAYKSVKSYEPDAYADASMTKTGYNIEFDFLLVGGNVVGRSASQFIVTTAGPNLATNNVYSGTDYIFSLSQPTLAAEGANEGIGGGKTGTAVTTWYINDLTNATSTTVTLDGSTWYHLALVVTATSVDYTITDNSTSEAVATGSKSVAELPTIKGFFDLLGRGSGKLNFDNLDIYDYTEEISVSSPIFTFNKVNGVKRNYTITNPNDLGTLYYTTAPAETAPAVGDAAYTSTTDMSKAVEFSESGKYYAYVLHTNGTTASAVVEQAVTAGAIQLNAPVATLSDMAQAEDGFFYPIYSFSSNQSNLEGTPTGSLSATSYTFTGTGSYEVTVTADGYTSNSITVNVDARRVLGKTIDFGAMTAADFSDATVWTSATGAPRDYWTNRAAAIPADVTYYKLTDPTADCSDVLDGITITNGAQRQPEVYIGYGLLTPYTAVSGSGNYMNLKVNDGTATDMVVFNGWNNYGSGTFNTVLAGDATFGLYRYDTMLRTIKVYSAVPGSVSATIGSDAIATFSSEYAVDFSAENGVTVYTAKVNDGKTAVVLTEVTSKIVPANTGVILKGDAGTYNAAVVASAAALENNQLAVSDGTSNVKGSFVLTKSGDKVVFGVWDSETPLSKGRVYLPADVVSGAKTLNIIFDGETTGINDVSRLNNAEMTSDKVVFNLNGQRIAAPQKGINIINGRKVIVK